MSWASEFPPELLCRPTGLVVLTGLDLVYNAIHKVVWDAFCNNRRPDRVPMQFKVLAADHEYPKCRSKRASYEWYIPKGILKTTWMKKHLEQIPSVVVVFYELDWDEPLWKEKQMECATKVEIVRNSLVSRGTKVCVLLIQKNAPLLPGEDAVAAERAASLCTACELSAKSLFVLSLSDHLQGYVIRLENAFYELAQNYYHTEARKVKAHKEFLNKTNHQLLFVRHQFKIAFFNEMKQDTHAALKHYKQAYSHVLELRIHDTNVLEVKTIAGFINYKICRLSFQHNAPLDAISQFRKHIDFFKKNVGIPDLAFEHSAWMSKQFQVFGDLFDEAIKLGLSAVQTQHPGFYYQQAANHAASRKQLCRQLPKVGSVVPSPDPLERLNNLDYYGQRPWRQGHQSIDPPDALRERDGIQALQMLEMKVDHSWLIIPLLSSAVSQFKKYKSPRMKRYLMVQMGEEYFEAKEYTKALTLLTRVMWDYRQERWWSLLTAILITGLRCAYLVGNIQEYVTISLELIGKYTLCPPEEKTRVQMNLIRVMSNEAPEPEPHCAPASVEKAKMLWRPEAMKAEPYIFTIEMHNIVPFVECKARFTQNSFTADTKVSLNVFLRTSSPFPIRFSKLSVLLSNQIYNQNCVITDQGPDKQKDSIQSDLYILPDKMKTFSFSFFAQPEDTGKILEITSLALELGSESSRCAILHWSGGGGDAVAPPVSQQAKNMAATRDSSDDPSWDMIKVGHVTKLQSRPAVMTISVNHQPPALVSEYYVIKVIVKNDEDKEISNVQLAFGLKEGQDSVIEQSTHISVDSPIYDGKVICKRGGLDLGTLAPSEQIEKVFFMKNLQTGTRSVYAKVSYKISVERDEQSLCCTCYKEETFTVATVDPFDVKLSIYSMQYEKLEVVHAETPFLLLSDLVSHSPWPTEIQSSNLQLSSYVSHEGEDCESQLKGVCLKPGDGAGECWCLNVPQLIQPTVSIGTYILQWKRQTPDESITLPWVETTIDLPSIRVEHVPLFIDLDLPAHGNVRKSMYVTYNIYNRTPYSQEIELNMEPSDSFMFSGHKQVHFSILPNSKHQVSYNFVPLLPGNHALPRLHVNMLRYPGTMDDVIARMLPTTVFVMPSGRFTVNDTEALIESEA